MYNVGRPVGFLTHLFFSKEVLRTKPAGIISVQQLTGFYYQLYRGEFNAKIRSLVFNPIDILNASRTHGCVGRPG
jgi:hypothetical protein